MLTLGFVGDFNLAGVNLHGRKYLEQTYTTCRSLTEQVDLSIANLECCLVPPGNYEKIMAIPDSLCHDIVLSGFDVFCMANNHIRDFGGEALIFTQQFLNNHSIACVGAGFDINSATQPLIIERAGKRIAIINVTDATHYKAGTNKPGVAPLIKRNLKKLLKSLENVADLIVVSIHADLEFSNYPAPWKIRLSRQLVRSGADIVIHHHPHTLQGIENYHGGLIAYSLGNFVFPVHGREYMANRDGNVDESIFLRCSVEFEESGEKLIRHDIIPVIIDNDNVTVVATESKANLIRQKLSEYSAMLNQPQELRRIYFKRCVQNILNLIFGTYYAFRRNGISDAISYLNAHLGTKMHRNWMRGLITNGWL